MPEGIGYGPGTKKLRRKDKFDKPSFVDKVLYKTAQAQTELKRLVRRKKKKKNEVVPGSQRDVLQRNLSQKEIDRFK